MAHDPHTKATLAQRRLIARLFASDQPGAAAIASVLDACTARRPCKSAACPICGLRFQQAAVAVVDCFIRIPARAIRSRMTLLTIVPSSGCLHPEELSVEACQRVAAAIMTTLAALGLPPAIVGLEVSFNEDTTGETEPHWCVHCHGIEFDWLSKDQERALRAAFPSSRLVRRPIHCVPLDHEVEGRRYPFKPERVRRVTELDDSNPDRRTHRQTKRRPLRSEQSVSLAIVDHQLGFGGRLLTHGIDEEAVRQHIEGLQWARDGP